MSKYTTGEIARLCGVSVRTVQYYDTRNILIPSELSEGGRRLYSDDDVRRLKIICFLREVGLPINSIGELLSEDDPQSVIEIMLDQREDELKAELEERRNGLEKISYIRRELKGIDDFSIESIGDIACILENRKKLTRVRVFMLTVGIIAELIEWCALIIGFVKGIWWPFIVGIPIVIALAVWIVCFYYRNVHYICPKCHTVFKPKFADFMFSNHTLTTRRLTCTSCGHRGFCVETAVKDIKNEESDK